MLCGEDLSKFRTSIGNIINDICTNLCYNGVVFCKHYIPMSRSLTPKAVDVIFIQWSLAELGCLCNGSATSTPKTVTRFVNFFCAYWITWIHFFFKLPTRPSGISLHMEYQSWLRHQMETCSALLTLFAGNSQVTGALPAKGQWRGALMFSLIWKKTPVD